MGVGCRWLRSGRRISAVRAIRPAWRALMDGDLERARAFVGAIRFRTLLSAETRACLDWVEGCIAEDDGVVKRDSSSAV